MNFLIGSFSDYVYSHFKLLRLIDRQVEMKGIMVGIVDRINFNEAFR